ncbi:MAG: EAL domain-containing protein [Wenzhouxiangellaceae bacterium]
MSDPVSGSLRRFSGPLEAASGIVLILLGALIAAYWGSELDRRDAASRLELASSEIVATLDLALDEFLAVRRKIDAGDQPLCSRQSLEYFRRLLFEQQFLRDIGIVRDNHLRCSTVLGVIESPRRNSPPDFRLPSGLEIYAFHPVRISTHYKTMIVQDERANALIDPGLIAGFTSARGIDALYIDPGPESPAHGLFTPASQPPEIVLEERVCSVNHGYCITAGIGPERVHSQSARTISLAILGGGSGLAVFLAMQSLLLRSRDPVMLLRRAIRTGKLQAVYQPLYHLPDGKVFGLELLARWPDAPEHLKGPERFVAEAELHGFVDQLTYCMLSKAAEELGGWLSANPQCNLNINLSAEELESERLPEMLQRCLVDRGMDPGRIVLELTERSFSQPDRQKLDRLIERGFRIFIDDLGEGSNNLLKLLEMPLDGIKISRTFTSGLGSDSPKTDLVRAMIGMAQDQNLTVVLEGIEDEAQHRAACDFTPLIVQGFYYARPMSAAQLLKSGIPRLKPVS